MNRCVTMLSSHVYAYIGNARIFKPPIAFNKAMSYAHVDRKATKLKYMYKKLLACDAIVINSWLNFFPNVTGIDK